MSNNKPPTKQSMAMEKMLDEPNGELSIKKLSELANCGRNNVQRLIEDLEEKKIVSGTKITNVEKFIAIWEDKRGERLNPEARRNRIAAIAKLVQIRKKRELHKLRELPRGMRDLKSEELEKINLIKDTFQETAKIFGFKQMDPSPIESFLTLEYKGGPAIRKEIYDFIDKGGRKLGLRFDFTVGLTRYVTSQQSLRLPAKFSAFGGVWRYDEPQKGRYRYFNQWNVEIYGKPSVETNAEIIEFTARLFENLKITNIEIQINNRKLVQSYIKTLFEKNYDNYESEPFESDDEHLMSDVLRAIDKITKKSEEEILNEYEKKNYDRQKIKKILKFSKTKGTPEQIESDFSVSDLDSWDELKQLWNSLKNRDVNNVQINFGIVRGLDYYSGMVLEVYEKKSEYGALAGGGTYDTLTKAFGRDDLSATGVAGGVERIMLTMDEQNIVPIDDSKIVSIVYANDENQKRAIHMASMLRKHKISVEIDIVGKAFKKQMESSKNSNFIVIIGLKEVSENFVMLKDMKSGTENIIKIENVLPELLIHKRTS